MGFSFFAMQSRQILCLSNWGFFLQMVQTTLTCRIESCFFQPHYLQSSWVSAFFSPQLGHKYFFFYSSVHSLHMLQEVSLRAGLNLHIKQIFSSEDFAIWFALFKQEVQTFWSLEAFGFPQTPHISSLRLYSTYSFRLSSFASRTFTSAFLFSSSAFSCSSSLLSFSCQAASFWFFSIQERHLLYFSYIGCFEHYLQVHELQKGFKVDKYYLKLPQLLQFIEFYCDATSKASLFFLFSSAACDSFKRLSFSCSTTSRSSCSF